MVSWCLTLQATLPGAQELNAQEEAEGGSSARTVSQLSSQVGATFP